jgi:activator of HSP90 ATPase
MKMLKAVYHFKAPLEKVWQTLVDPMEIEHWGGGPAEMSADEGASFKLWNGDIHGTNIEVSPEEKLIQDWYGGAWDEPSRVTITLTEEDRGTRVDLLHENIPADEFDDITEGWDEYYFGAIKKYLEQA